MTLAFTPEFVRRQQVVNTLAEFRTQIEDVEDVEPLPLIDLDLSAGLLLFDLVCLFELTGTEMLSLNFAL